MENEIQNINILEFRKNLSISEKNDLLLLFHKLCGKWGLNKISPTADEIWKISLANFNLLVKSSRSPSLSTYGIAICCTSLPIFL